MYYDATTGKWAPDSESPTAKRITELEAEIKDLKGQLEVVLEKEKWGNIAVAGCDYCKTTIYGRDGKYNYNDKWYHQACQLNKQHEENLKKVRQEAMLQLAFQLQYKYGDGLTVSFTTDTEGICTDANIDIFYGPPGEEVRGILDSTDGEAIITSRDKLESSTRELAEQYGYNINHSEPPISFLRNHLKKVIRENEDLKADASRSEYEISGLLLNLSNKIASLERNNVELRAILFMKDNK